MLNFMNISSKSQVFLIGRTDKQKDRRKDRQTKLRKLIIAFLNFANAPEN